MRPLQILLLAAGLLLTAMPASEASAQNPFLENKAERTVGEIVFEGNTNTRDYVLIRALGLRTGDPFDPVELSAGWEALEDLPYISYVDIESSREAGEKIDLHILIEEDGRFFIFPDYQYSRRHDRHILGVQGHFLNLSGRGERLSFRSEWLAKHGYQLAWQNPWILNDAKLAVEVDALWERYDFGYEDFEFTEWGFGAGLSRDIIPGLRARLDGRWRELQIDDVVGHDPHLQLGVELERTNLYHYPSKGVRGEVWGRRAALGEEVGYEIYQGSLSGFWPLGPIGIIGGHQALRIAGSSLPIYERSWLGGPENLRGIAFGSVEGDHAWRATLELRRPFVVVPLREGRSIGVGAHAFHDWGGASESGDFTWGNQIRRSFGAGLHFNFNTRNFRLEWAHSDDGEDHLVFEDRFTF